MSQNLNPDAQIPESDEDKTYWTATYRAVYDASNERDAYIISEHLRNQIEKELDLDEGDSVERTQLVGFTTQMTPQEICDQFRLSRNLLIRTKWKDCWTVAQELDKIIYALSHRTEEHDPLVGYNWNHFIEVTAEVLKGKMPTD